jgi:DNA-binding CsgD family transcriptional regulator
MNDDDSPDPDGDRRQDAIRLTDREIEVARLIGEGLTSRQIAAHLVVSRRTVDSHAEHIRDKLGLRSRAQIATWIAQRDSPF